MAFVSNATAATVAKTPAGQLKAKAESQKLVASNRDRVALVVGDLAATLVVVCLAALSRPSRAADAPEVKRVSFKFATQTLSVPEGFTVELVAGPPAVNRPISIAITPCLPDHRSPAHRIRGLTTGGSAPPPPVDRPAQAHDPPVRPTTS